MRGARTLLVAFTTVDAVAVSALCRLSWSISRWRTGFADGPGMPFLIGYDLLWFAIYLAVTGPALVLVARGLLRKRSVSVMVRLFTLSSLARTLFAFTVWYNREITRFLLVRFTRIVAWPFGIVSWPVWRWVVLVVVFDLLLLWLLVTFLERRSDFNDTESGATHA